MAPREGKSIEEIPLPDVQYDRNELYSNLADVINGEAEQIVTGASLRVLKLMEAALKALRRAL